MRWEIVLYKFTLLFTISDITKYIFCLFFLSLILDVYDTMIYQVKWAYITITSFIIKACNIKTRCEK